MINTSISTARPSSTYRWLYGNRDGHNADRRLVKLGSACHAEYETGLSRHPVPKYVEIRNKRHTGRVDKTITSASCWTGGLVGSSPAAPPRRRRRRGLRTALHQPAPFSYIPDYQAGTYSAYTSFGTMSLRRVVFMGFSPLIPAVWWALWPAWPYRRGRREFEEFSITMRPGPRRRRRRRECGLQDQATGVICQEDSGIIGN